VTTSKKITAGATTKVGIQTTLTAAQTALAGKISVPIKVRVFAVVY
jgi:hypothetical protein